MHLERQQGILDRLVEAEPRDHRAKVSTRAHQSGHDGELLAIHERNDAVARAFSHLHKEREAHQHRKGDIPRLGVVHVPEAKQEDCLKEKGQELGPNAAAEAEELEHDVTADAAQGTCEEVHEAEGARQSGSIPRIHLEVSPEMCRQLVVHGELCSETCGVLEDHDDHTGILQHLHIVPHRGLLGLASDGNIESLGRGRVPAQELHASGTDQEHHRRHNHGHAPGSVWLNPTFNHGVEQHGHHENLSHASAQVAPSGRRGIRGAHHVRGEHQGAPELVRDECGAGTPNEKADQRVIPWG
mmetsp:Transcript_62781/g.140089  ORF Transcript_62781/g.140089 Transcript_62781/m.140089 type:complete len:299 (+) Transcript_62781:551-1447(+)